MEMPEFLSNMSHFELVRLTLLLLVAILIGAAWIWIISFHDRERERHHLEQLKQLKKLGARVIGLEYRIARLESRENGENTNAKETSTQTSEANPEVTG